MENVLLYFNRATVEKYNDRVCSLEKNPIDLYDLFPALNSKILIWCWLKMIGQFLELKDSNMK